MNLERIRMHLVQAFTRANNPDVRHHLAAVLAELSPTGEPPLITCPDCGLAGLPGRIAEHECPDSER